MRTQGTKRRFDADEGERQPVRRSARLAGLLPPAPSTFVIEVDRSPPTPSRSVLDSQSQADAEPSTSLSKMHLVVAPPETIVAGIALTSPVLVTFEISDATTGEKDDESAVVDFNGCWAFLSLVTEDRKQVLAPPRSDLLEGTITDSIHELDNPQNGSSMQIVGYAAFKDLKISEPGRYCFGVNVVDMNDTISSTEVKISKVIHSDIFQVVDGAQAQGS